MDHNEYFSLDLSAHNSCVDHGLAKRLKIKALLIAQSPILINFLAKTEVGMSNSQPKAPLDEHRESL